MWKDLILEEICKIKIKRVLILLVLFVVCPALVYKYARPIWVPLYYKVSGMRTIDEVVQKYGQFVEGNLQKSFQEAGVKYPPSSIHILAFKAEKNMEVWAQDNEKMIHILSYKIKAASGRTGPKLIRGDAQVPEGIYKLESLNPNSRFHLSIKIAYPNVFDLNKAKSDGRTDVGGDIFIHGSSVSSGCLAMGDEVIEELFVLVNKVGLVNSEVIIAPYDMRVKQFTTPIKPGWLPELYEKIGIKLMGFKVEQ